MKLSEKMKNFEIKVLLDEEKKQELSKYNPDKNDNYNFYWRND